MVRELSLNVSEFCKTLLPTTGEGDIKVDEGASLSNFA